MYTLTERVSNLSQAVSITAEIDVAEPQFP